MKQKFFSDLSKDYNSVTPDNERIFSVNDQMQRHVLSLSITSGIKSKNSYQYLAIFGFLSFLDAAVKECPEE